jgi:hypothetical protein
MGREVTTKRTGRIVGYVFKHVDRHVEKQHGVTVAFDAKVGAFVHVQPEGSKRYHTIPCRSAELVYDEKLLQQLGVVDAESLSQEQRDASEMQVFNTLCELHPAGSVRNFREIQKEVLKNRKDPSKGKRTKKVFELVE